MKSEKILKRKTRQKRIRDKVKGTATKPRLCVFRSIKHISAQLIDDISGKTIASSSTTIKDLSIKNGGNVEAAIAVGKDIAKKAKEKNIENVVFDRAGFLYHGRIKALADAAREEGLKF